MSVRRVYIDTDIALGCQNADVDDAVAVLLALAEPSLSVIGISPSSGNVPGFKSGPCLDALLNRIGKSDVPHASFASGLWDQSGWVASHRWINQPKEKTFGSYGNEMRSADFMVNTLLAEKEPVEMITIGPLSNLATALVLCSEIKKKITHLSMMGGTWKTPGVGGNPIEFNMLCDPEAASFVMQSGIPVRMFGLDVTKKRKITPPDMQPWINSSSPFLRDLGEKCIAFMEFRAKRDGYDTSYAFFHDVMPVLSLVHPEWFTMRPCDIQVDTQGEFTRGMTVIDFKKRTRSALSDAVAIDVDCDRVFSYVLNAFLATYGSI